MKSTLKITFHIIIIVLLTIITQVGGIIYVITLVSVKRKAKLKRLKKAFVFIGLYSIATFIIIPVVAPIFGREKIEETNLLQAHSFFYKLANRNYVTPELNVELKNISKDFSRKNNEIKVVYLDANFPFLDGFPLLPHLSHNDGKKIDISFIYKDKNGLTNRKPSVSGYGIYEAPTEKEYNQNEVCKNKGNWQYDFPKYLTFGDINNDIKFSKKGTKSLANSVVNNSKVSKLFIEPHLKKRLNLTSSKVRFHGCQAVRHDDHIHFQLK